MITRRQFLTTAAAAAAVAGLALSSGSGGGSLAAGPDPRRPNILFILSDEWRGGATGYAGDPNVQTPNLDRLAGQSLNFRNTVSVCPVCTPYRAALMTGRFPTSTGMFLNDLYLPDAEVCLAEALKAASYSTGYIGKWHLDGHGRASFIPPQRRQGWDYWKAAECDHHYLRSHYYTGNAPEKHFWDGYDVFAQTRDAQDYIRAHAGKPDPFALLVSYGPPHYPFGTAPQQFRELYSRASIALPPNVPADLAEAAREDARGYYAHCSALDAAIGDLLATLQQSGIARDTIVVFTSDHGDMMGSHGCPGGTKQVPWDESARVPLLVRYPSAQFAPGRTIETPVTTPDLAVTLLALAGIPVPPAMEGCDLSDVIRTGQEQDRAALYMALDPSAATDVFREYRAIRTKRHTYVRGLHDGVLLYDDLSDPSQMANLAGRPECAPLRQEMERRLQAELDRIGDSLRPAEYYLQRWGLPLKPYTAPRMDDRIYSPAGRRAAGRDLPDA